MPTQSPQDWLGSVTCRFRGDRHSGTAGNQGQPKRETCHGSRLRDTCQSRGSRDNAQKGESTKSFAPIDFFGDPDEAQNPTNRGSQNEKAKSHKPRLELGFTGGIGGQLQQLVGGLSITQEEHVCRNSCGARKTPEY